VRFALVPSIQTRPLINIAHRVSPLASAPGSCGSIIHFLTSSSAPHARKMASRTTGRTSARSSVSRDQASSPPKLASDRQSHSPVARRTRSTRSQSVDLGESDSGVTTRKGARRTMRQGSVESVDSNASAASSIKVRPSRKTRTARTSPGQSIMAPMILEAHLLKFVYRIINPC
jgi:hypothetical protein